MDKILIEVSVPVIERKFDVFIPVNKKISRVIVQLSQAINELTDDNYVKKNNTVLCNKYNGSMYNPDAIVKDSGLVNGSKVFLI